MKVKKTGKKNYIFLRSCNNPSFKNPQNILRYYNEEYVQKFSSKSEHEKIVKNMVNNLLKENSKKESSFLTPFR